MSGNALEKLLQTRMSGVFNALKTSWKIKLHADGTVLSGTVLFGNLQAIKCFNASFKSVM